MTQHPGDLTRQPEQLGIRTYTTTSPVLVKAVQLTEEADWEAIATWCGGRVNHERSASGQDVPVLLVPGGNGGWVGREDWVIQGVTGSYFVRSPEEFAATYTPHTDHGPSPATVRDTALKLIRRGYFDPGATLAREFDQGPDRDETEPVWAWGARAALANLVEAGLLASTTPAGRVTEQVDPSARRAPLVARLRSVIEWVSERDHNRAIELDGVVHELEAIAAGQQVIR